MELFWGKISWNRYFSFFDKFPYKNIKQEWDLEFHFLFLKNKQMRINSNANLIFCLVIFLNYAKSFRCKYHCTFLFTIFIGIEELILVIRLQTWRIVGSMQSIIFNVIEKLPLLLILRNKPGHIFIFL